MGRWSKRKTGNHCTARLFIKRVKDLCGNQPKMAVFRKGVYHAETNHVLEMMMLILNQFSSTILKIFSSSFVGLKSIVSLQLRATMTGLIKEVINRSSGHPQGGRSQMGEKGVEGGNGEGGEQS